MKISCELPNDLLLVNNAVNEYDFVLFHLYLNNSDYKSFYSLQRILHPKRLMIFDNSAYEFFVQGKELDLDLYLKCINELRPDYYILPDVLMDKDKTIENVHIFLKKYANKVNTHSKPIAVIQGNSQFEMLKCLMEYKSLKIENIAIPFHNSFYKTTKQIDDDIKMLFYDEYKNITEDIKYAMGRVQFLRNIQNSLKSFKKIHILGSHCPLEKVYYKQYDTMDTGYPVKCGLLGVKLGQETEKPNIIIDEFINKPIDDKIQLNIIENIIRFKKLN